MTINIKNLKKILQLKKKLTLDKNIIKNEPSFTYTQKTNRLNIPLGDTNLELKGQHFTGKNKLKIKYKPIVSSKELFLSHEAWFSKETFLYLPKPFRKQITKVASEWRVLARKRYKKLKIRKWTKRTSLVNQTKIINGRREIIKKPVWYKIKRPTYWFRLSRRRDLSYLKASLRKRQNKRKTRPNSARRFFRWYHQQKKNEDELLEKQKREKEEKEEEEKRAKEGLEPQKKQEEQDTNQEHMPLIHMEMFYRKTKLKKKVAVKRNIHTKIKSHDRLAIQTQWAKLQALQIKNKKLPKPNPFFVFKWKQDIYYNSRWFYKFWNKSIKKGKKTLAESINKNVLKNLKHDLRSSSFLTVSAMLDILKPVLSCVRKRVGKQFYQIPFPVRRSRSYKIALDWIIKTCQLRSERTYIKRLSSEILAILKRQKSFALKQRNDLYFVIHENRTYINFRWM